MLAKAQQVSPLQIREACLRLMFSHEAAHKSQGSVRARALVQHVWMLQIVNRSKITAEVSFGGCTAALEQQGVELHPHDLNLPPRGIAELTFTYR